MPVIRAMDYVELHCKSNFSFLDGAAHPESLVHRASELGYDSLALTDANGLYGIVRFNQAASEYGLKPIFGSELILEDESRLVLLVSDNRGYANLSTMLTRAHGEHAKGEGRVSFSLLEQHTEGLIVLSGDTLHKSLLDDDRKETLRRARYFASVYGLEKFYLEIYNHNLPYHNRLCKELIAFGRQHNFGLVATNCVYYAEPDDRRLYDILTCVKHGVTLDEAGPLLYPNNEPHLKSHTVMEKEFSHCPEAIANSVRIADRCEFALNEVPSSLPDFPIPEGDTVDSYLRQLTYEGAGRRFRYLSAKIRGQIDKELEVISRLNLAGYFLIVWDICRYCREQNILCQGRGSAANSAVCFCLEITAVDPIRLDLLFERFLSEDRKEPPDIDIDIDSDRREEVIQYVYELYGRDNAAMVSNVICYRRRLAVREVGKVLGFSLDQIDGLSKCLDHFTDDQAETVSRFKDKGINVNDRRVKLLIELYQKLQGFPRHLGIHCGGMIITKAPLGSVVPIENATMPNRSVIQWDKDDSADMGLVKFDLLGLGMLTMIDLALKLVEKQKGTRIDVARLDYADPKVYDLLCQADTVGVFQVESRAQMNTLPRMKPNCFYDLVIEVAIIRPGPIQGDMVHPFLRRRNGEEPVDYLHPSLEPILKRTLGVPLFQEQGIRVAVVAAGFTPSQADSLRRSIGHKQSKKRIGALYESLIEGMRKNGIERKIADKIYTQLAAFSEFGFAESHAASFALLVYVSAWLKVYYPVEFYCGLLNAQPMGFYTPSSIVYEAIRKGIEVRNVCINESEWQGKLENDAIRLGLCHVLSVGAIAGDKLLAERTKEQFKSIDDVVFRSGLNEKQLEQLAQVGALDCFGLSRRRALWKVLSLINRTAGELELVVPDDGSGLIPEMTSFDRVRSDVMGLNLSTGPHPMELFRKSLDSKKVHSSTGLLEVADKKFVYACGMVVIRQRPVTAKGFVFLTLEDETGFANIVVKPNMVKKFRKEVIFSHALLVWGQVERKDGVVNVIGRKFQVLTIDGEKLRLKSRDFR